MIAGLFKKTIPRGRPGDWHVRVILYSGERFYCGLSFLAQTATNVIAIKDEAIHAIYSQFQPYFSTSQAAPMLAPREVPNA